MLNGILKVAKWWAIGIATAQLVSGYKKDKTFKTRLDKAEGVGKIKEALNYLVDTNKKLFEQGNLYEVVENIKQSSTASTIRKKVIKKQTAVKENIVSNLEKVQLKFNNAADELNTKAKKTVGDAIILLEKKLGIIEDELETFESKSSTYADDTWTEYYRQLASKFALFKKTATRYMVDGALAAEEKFDVENKIKFIADRLEQLKKMK